MPARNHIDVDRVKQLLANGSTPKQIAERLGVNKVSVYQIAKAWRAKA